MDNAFPSPCGVWDVSFERAANKDRRGGPSPCGVWVVSRLVRRMQEAKEVSVPLRGVGCFVKSSETCKRTTAFPSPCGVWVVSK